MKIIHMSDIHLTRPGETIGGLDPHARLDQALQHCQTNHPDAERIIITGDLAHWGEAEAYEALRQRANRTSMPLRLLLGNHDDRSNFLKAFADHPRDDNGFVIYAEDIDGLNFIYCDTNQRLTHAGHFDARRRESLHGLLSASPGSALVFMHHNPAPTGMAAVDSIGLIAEDSTALADLLRAHAGKVRHIFFGHTHLTLSGSFAGVPFSCVRSTLHQSLPNYSADPMLHGGEFQPHYSVITFAGDLTMISHVPFAYDGPVRRSGTAWDDWAKPEGVA